MSAYTIMKCLREWTINPEEAAVARASSAAELSERYGLTAEEAQLLIDGRVDVLDGMGVHPFSLIQLSRVMGFPIDARWKELLGEDGAKEESE